LKKLSLKYKLVGLTAGLFILSMVVFIATSAATFNQSARTSQEQMAEVLASQAEVNLQEASLNTAEVLSGLLSRAHATTATAAEQLQQTAIGVHVWPLPRDDVKQLLLSTLKSNTAISAIYAQFEPDGYDGLDEFYRGNLNHSTFTGDLEVYFVRDGDQITYFSTEDASEKLDDTRDEFGQRAAEYYLCARDSRQPCLLDPYLYELETGEQILMTTISIPIVVDGEFRGHVGADINLPVLQQEIEALSDRLYDGAGDAILVSQIGLLAASSRHPDDLGDSLANVQPALQDYVTRDGLQQVGDNWYFSQPVGIEGVSQEWRLMVSVPESVILAPALALAGNLEAAAQRSLGTLILMGVVLAVVVVGIMTLLLNTIVRPIGKMAERMNDLASAEGDLTASLNVDSHRELMELADGFNRFTAKLREMISQMKTQNDALNADARKMNDNSHRVGTAATSQTERLDNVVAAVNQMSSAASEVAQLAGDNSEAADTALSYINQSQQSLSENRTRVEQLSGKLESSSQQVAQVAQRSQEINGILETIQSIAEQTNLLALNAAIEAARAGEQGRGFAVVADEVRSLAARTHKSTQEVEGLIKGLQDDVGSAVEQLDQCREEMAGTVTLTQQSLGQLDDAVSQVNTINNGVAQVATAAQEQSQVNEEINRSITEIGDGARDLSELAAEVDRLTQTTTKALEALAAELNRLRV